ncbi:TPA: replication initiation factor domain-containing protein [Vibrio vulnificus]|nr:replication initiation factor family protein [Vibrio vulnificus]HDY7624999.1 replication initiation factor domain-containing protein [Vibrio vulnificus]HEB2784017.1 replication initiation factor domain-containing protein [Vibrio vulnificus]
MNNRLCMECGAVYHSLVTCCCPECGSGVIWQQATTTDTGWKFAHKLSSDYIFRPKKAGLRPEFVPHHVEQFRDVEDYEQSLVVIDYLTFTVKINDFRHCKKESPYSGIHFPSAPVFESHNAKTTQEIEAYSRYYRDAYMEYLQETVRRFITHVLGFNYSAPRGKGFQFYDDSFILTSADGDDYCGQVGVGGNNDTIHFQINGHGCKHLFLSRSCRYVHHWLNTVLGVKHLARVDLAFDDFDGVHTCDAAERAAWDNGFRTAVRGRSPKIGRNDEYYFNSDTGEKVFTKEQCNVGSRQSNVYWRIYNKKLERNIESEDFVWYRSEVELKKWDVDVILNPLAAFKGLCAYSSSLISDDITPVKTNRKSKSKKRVALDLVSAAYWMKRQYGKTLNALVEFHNGDLEKVVSSLVRDGTSFTFPSSHQRLMNVILE